MREMLQTCLVIALLLHLCILMPIVLKVFSYLFLVFICFKPSFVFYIFHFIHLTVEWTSPLGRVVDPFACYRYQPSVKDSMYMPRPPGYNPPKQGPGVDLSDALGSHQRSGEQLTEARREFK